MFAGFISFPSVPYSFLGPFIFFYISLTSIRFNFFSFFKRGFIFIYFPVYYLLFIFFYPFSIFFCDYVFLRNKNWVSYAHVFSA